MGAQSQFLFRSEFHFLGSKEFLVCVRGFVVCDLDEQKRKRESVNPPTPNGAVGVISCNNNGTQPNILTYREREIPTLCLLQTLRCSEFRATLVSQEVASHPTRGVPPKSAGCTMGRPFL